MTAISKAFVTIADTAVDPDSPIDTTLMTGLRDDVQHLREWLGASYYAGAVQDHNHDGNNSAAVQIGANYLRNGSFESGLVGWALTNYVGGAQVIDTTHAMDGTQCLAITSTVLANGGGYAQTTEFEPVEQGRSYSVTGCVFASVVNVSSKVEIVWFDSTKTQISISTIYSNTATPTAASDFSAPATAPANARYKQLRITGGIPGVGSAVGTIYFDSLIASPSIFPAVAGPYYLIAMPASVAVNTTSPVKYLEYRIPRAGVWRTSLNINGNASAYITGQVYKNGVAYGTTRSTSGTVLANWTEDLSFVAGDLCQFYGWENSAGFPGFISGTLGELSGPALIRTL